MLGQGNALNRGTVLRVEDARKTFGAKISLDGLSMEVMENEKVGLLGPNGAGKTTLVRSICGRIRLQSGAIEICGRSPLEKSALTELGVVPQELAIYPDLTAQENLLAFGRLHGIRGRQLRERVEWALEWIDLVDRRNDLLKNFSGGMKRRVNIACGVLHRPRILLLDEPTVGVDPQSRNRIFEMIDQLHLTGTSIVLTTHHLDEAEQVCDRIVIVDHGKTIAEGTVGELIQRTVGKQCRLTMHTDRLIDPAGTSLTWDRSAGCLVGTVADVETELPRILQEIHSIGASVLDIEMQKPNLNHVFLHLTGRELRE